MKIYDDEIEYREDCLLEMSGLFIYVYFEGRQRLQNRVCSTLQEGTKCVGFAGYKRRRPAFKIKRKPLFPIMGQHL